ncbi:MAG: hypothetical protein WA790_20765 [Sulfitobacter sp.]
MARTSTNLSRLKAMVRIQMRARAMSLLWTRTAKDRSLLSRIKLPVPSLRAIPMTPLVSAM